MRVTINAQQIVPKRLQLTNLVAWVIKEDRTREEKGFPIAEEACKQAANWLDEQESPGLKSSCYQLSFSIVENPCGGSSGTVDAGKVAIARQNLRTLAEYVESVGFTLQNSVGDPQEMICKTLCESGDFHKFLDGKFKLTPTELLTAMPTMDLGGQDLTYNSNAKVARGTFRALLMLAIAAYYDSDMGTSKAGNLLDIGNWLGATQKNCNSLARVISGTRKGQGVIQLPFRNLRSDKVWHPERDVLMRLRKHTFP